MRIVLGDELLLKKQSESMSEERIKNRYSLQPVEEEGQPPKIRR